MADWCITYNDLCNEIEILEIRASGIKDEMKYLKRHMDTPPRTKLVASYSGMPGGSGTLSFERMSGQYCTLQATLDDVNDILSLKREAQRRMAAKMNNFEDLSQRVMVMRDIQRMPLHNIAKELGYSDSYIRKVSMKTSRRKFRVSVKQGTIREHIS